MLSDISCFYTWTLDFCCLHMCFTVGDCLLETHSQLERGCRGTGGSTAKAGCVAEIALWKSLFSLHAEICCCVDICNACYRHEYKIVRSECKATYKRKMQQQLSQEHTLASKQCSGWVDASIVSLAGLLGGCVWEQGGDLHKKSQTNTADICIHPCHHRTFQNSSACVKTALQFGS